MESDAQKELKRRRQYPIKIDVEQLTSLASYHCDRRDIAHWFQCAISTLSQEPWHSIIEEARAKTRISLKKKLLQKALNENDTKCLIMALKNYCSFQENPTHNQPNEDDGSSNDNFEGFSINDGR